MRHFETIKFIHDLVTYVQPGTQTDVIGMDFSKAFDKVRHNKLISKLHHQAIQDKTNWWIRSVLSNITQRGAPQGSVFGPCLFFFYINDIPENITSTSTFAGDTLICLALKPKSNAAVLHEGLDKR